MYVKKENQKRNGDNMHHKERHPRNALCFSRECSNPKLSLWPQNKQQKLGGRRCNQLWRQNRDIQGYGLGRDYVTRLAGHSDRSQYGRQSALTGG